jgi:hypothetical protein
LAVVTVAVVVQRLRDDYHVDVSESTVRRYVATTFTEQRLEERVTVPRGAVEAGSEAQIDYGSVRPTGPQDGPKVLERLACRG